MPDVLLLSAIERAGVKRLDTLLTARTAGGTRTTTSSSARGSRRCWHDPAPGGPELAGHAGIAVRGLGLLFHQDQQLQQSQQQQQKQRYALVASAAAHSIHASAKRLRTSSPWLTTTAGCKRPCRRSPHDDDDGYARPAPSPPPLMDHTEDGGAHQLRPHPMRPGSTLGGGGGTPFPFAEATDGALLSPAARGPVCTPSPTTAFVSVSPSPPPPPKTLVTPPDRARRRRLVGVMGPAPVNSHV